MEGNAAMHRFTITMILVPILAVGASAPLARSPERDLSSGMTVSLVSEKTTYSLRDDLTLSVSLHNENNLHPVFVFSYVGWGKGGGFDLTIEDEHGHEIRTLAMDDAPIPLPRPDELAIFTRLSPGCFFGMGLDQPIRDFISAPGRYRIRATYSSIITPELVDERLRHLNVLWQGHTPIVSPWITIEVKR